MAVLNITPDSFSDGGKLFDGRAALDAVLSHAEACLAEGATILDVGGESTRPGAAPVSEGEECLGPLLSPYFRQNNRPTTQPSSTNSRPFRDKQDGGK